MIRSMRRLLLLLAICVAAFGQATLTIFALPDLTMTGSAIPLASSGVARECQLIALPANTAAIRFGDSTVSASKGAAISAGSGQFIPPAPETQAKNGTTFALASTYVIGTAGDKLSATCWR